MTKHPILVWLSPDVYRDFKAKCKAEGVEMAATLRKLGLKWLDGNTKRANEIQRGRPRKGKSDE